MNIPKPNHIGPCVICGEPLHDREEIVANKPRGSRDWVYAHAECLKPKNKDQGVRLK